MFVSIVNAFWIHINACQCQDCSLCNAGWLRWPIMITWRLSFSPATAAPMKLPRDERPSFKVFKLSPELHFKLLREASLQELSEKWKKKYPKCFLACQDSERWSFDSPGDAAIAQGQEFSVDRGTWVGFVSFLKRYRSTNWVQSIL